MSDDLSVKSFQEFVSFLKSEDIHFIRIYDGIRFVELSEKELSDIFKEFKSEVNNDES